MNKLIFLFTALLFFGCNEPREKKEEDTPEGKLFIIGGGKRPAEMIQKLTEISNLTESDKIHLLPWASSEPDSSSFYAKKQFEALGFKEFIDFQPNAIDSISEILKDDILSAKLIYIPGGDQRRFMETAIKYGYDQLLKEAYQNGATIAGTSAGAAIMSKKMITGTALKYEDYHPTFRTLESDNLELFEGLGLLPHDIIIDQHFIWRSRYNRLLTAVIEMPELTGWGIEESTAALVQGDSVTVVGSYQIVTFDNLGTSKTDSSGLLGAENIKISIYLPGESFPID